MNTIDIINKIKSKKLDNSIQNIVFSHVSDYLSLNEYIEKEIREKFFEFMDLITKEGIHMKPSRFNINLNNKSNSNEPKYNYKNLFLGKNLNYLKEGLKIYVSKENGDLIIENNKIENTNEFKDILDKFILQFNNYFERIKEDIKDSFNVNFKYYTSNFAIKNDLKSLSSQKNFINNIFNQNQFQNNYGSIRSTRIAYKIDKEYFYFNRGHFFTSNNNYLQNDTLKLINNHNLNFVEAMYLIGKLHGLQNKVKQEISMNETITFDDHNAIELVQEFEETLLDNYAKEEIITTLVFNQDTLESKFNDFQAFHICRGLRNQQFLYEKYLSNRFNLEDRFRAHKLANDTLKKFGKSYIDFILSLPTLPFKTDRFKVLFNKMDKMKENIALPTLRFSIKNVHGFDENIELEFLVQDGNIYKNQLRVKNTTTNQTVLNISRNGKVKLEDNVKTDEKNRNITPVIQLFYQIAKDENELNQAIISYGIESGKCSICGKTLTNELSKLEGIGPVCKTYL